MVRLERGSTRPPTSSSDGRVEHQFRSVKMNTSVYATPLREFVQPIVLREGYRSHGHYIPRLVRVFHGALSFPDNRCEEMSVEPCCSKAHWKATATGFVALVLSCSCPSAALGPPFPELITIPISCSVIEMVMIALWGPRSANFWAGATSSSERQLANSSFRPFYAVG